MVACRRLLAIFIALTFTAISLQPAFPQGSEADVYVAEAVLAYASKDYEKARRSLQLALQRDPRSVEARYYLGLIDIAQQKYRDALTPLEEAYAMAPDDIAVMYQLGVAYFSLDLYDKAEPLLSRVFVTDPHTANVGYYIGFMRYRQKDYKGALAAFASGASDDPGIKELTRFYAGLSLAILGLPQEAAKELEEAQRVRTVSPLTGPADRLRDTLIAQQEKDRRLHVQLRLGTYYDSNVPTNPSNQADPLGIVPSLRSRRANTLGELVAAQGQYAWWRRDGWESTLVGSYFKTMNNYVPSFNVDNYLGGTGLSYQGTVATLPFQTALQYTFDATMLGGSRFLNRHSVSLSGTLLENSWNLTTLQLRFQAKDFTNLFLVGGGTRAAENRDANNYMIGFTHMFRFMQDRLLVRAGYQYDQDDAKGQDWFYRGHRALSGVQYLLPWGDITVKYDFDIHFRRYPATNLLFAPGGNGQKVTEQNHIFRIEKPLPHNFVVAADYQADLSRANLPYVFSYNRHIVNLSVAWGF